jgi:hypothetical protein
LFLIVELAAVAIEFTNDWRRGESTLAQAEKIDTPLMGVGIFLESARSRAALGVLWKDYQLQTIRQ